ncbi:MAG: 5-formyltetrahydrofolate cyclo-ligase [Campylobacterota bacterium]|nr:5-formyltetrahydrofolate cyclo-ligase [Campylobacterota bacterium]
MTKENFRKQSFVKLKVSSKIGKIKKDKTVYYRIINIIDRYKPKNILLYIPLEAEVDVRPIINTLRKRDNCDVYVPFMRGKSFIPVKYRLPLKKKRFGIKEPNFSSFKNNKILFDMVIVPIIGIDNTFRRVGFGAGMYDRYFETLKKRPITIFTQLKLCYENSTITNKYDISPDYIIT